MEKRRMYPRAVRGLLERVFRLKSTSTNKIKPLGHAISDCGDPEDVMQPYNKKRERRALVKHIVGPETRILEIGALNSPTFTKADAEVKFADWISYEQLIEHYSHKSGIIPIDYLIEGARISESILRTQDWKFDLIVANHVIEHIPDLIGWMKELAKITESDAYIALAVPDKRYTFDIARNESDIAEIIDCHRQLLDAPSFRQILRHLYLKKAVTAKDIWAAEAELPQLKSKRMSLNEALERTEGMLGAFHSLHCHVFTKSSFEDVMTDLYESGIIPWKISKITDVGYGGNEFLVLLMKGHDDGIK